MNLNARVGLSWKGPLGRTQNVNAKASSLNLHGAAIELDRDLAAGQEVIIHNGRGLKCSARVVSLVKKVGDRQTYGVEFAGDPLNKFWGIVFPLTRTAGYRAVA